LSFCSLFILELDIRISDYPIFLRASEHFHGENYTVQYFSIAGGLSIRHALPNANEVVANTNEVFTVQRNSESYTLYMSNSTIKNYIFLRALQNYLLKQKIGGDEAPMDTRNISEDQLITLSRKKS